MFKVFKQKKETDAEVYEAVEFGLFLYHLLKINKHEVIQITLFISYLCFAIINHLV